MKIIVLGCKDYPAFKHAKDVGGIETFCNDVLPRLDDIEFMVFTRRYKNSLKEETIGNVKVIRSPFLNLPMLQTFTFNLFSFFKARKAKADLIWAHEPVAGFYAHWISKLTKIPYILHIHSRGSLEPANFNRRFWMKVMERYAYKNAKQVIFVSSNIVKDINKNGIVIPVGIDVDKFKSTSIDSDLSKINGKKICYLGRLSSVKGINYLIDSFARLNQNDLNLVIVGEGDQKSKLMTLTKKLNIENKVHFLGYKPSNTILPYIDVLVLPSLSEGLPHSVLEAIACKKPVVATSVGELPNLLKNYLAKPKDVGELAGKIEKALSEKKIDKIPKELKIEEVVASLRKLF